MAARLTTYLVVAIVSATLIAGLILGAQRNDTEGPIDLIVHHAVVYTADSDHVEEAVAIRGNQVLRVGSNRDIMHLQRPQTVMIDAGGGAVLPGFNDADVQPIAGGLALDSIDLAGAGDIQEIQARVRSWVEANPDRPWVIGHGWDPSLVPQGDTPRQWLDAAVPDRPASLISTDGAAAWVNTKALQAALPKGSSGAESSGVLKGSDLGRLDAALPRTSRATKAAALRAAIAEAHRLGITSLQHLGASVEDLELYAGAQRDGDLDVRVYGAVSLNGGTSDAEIARLDALASRYPDDPLLKAGAVALDVDGTVAAGTAAMLQPADGGAALVQPLVSADDLNRMVRLLDARGWQIAVHASGDRAVRMALDAFEHAARSNAEPTRGRRHRLEGVEAIDPADLPRLKSLGVVVSTASPAASGGPAAAGARVVIGSRWPLGALNPLLAVQSALDPAAKFSVKRALDALTFSAAYASFDEHRKGSLKAGMLADLVILTADVLSVPAARLSTIEVAATVFDGRIVYQRDKKTFP